MSGKCQDKRTVTYIPMYQKANTSLIPHIRKVKTKWLRDDCSFICVLPTDLEKHKGHDFFVHKSNAS